MNVKSPLGKKVFKELLRDADMLVEGNQPKLIADPAGDPARPRFEFVSGTNMKSPDEPHIHKAGFDFVGPDHIRSTWEMYTNGESMGVAKLAAAAIITAMANGITSAPTGLATTCGLESR